MAAELGEFQKADIYFSRQIYAFYGARLQLQGRDKDAIAEYRRSNELSVNQIAIGGAQQIQDSIKRKGAASARPD
jgi:hypothetical protein